MVKIDLERIEVHNGKKFVKLAPKEFEILKILTQADGRVLSRAQLIKKIWPKNGPRDSRSVDQHISRLRSKLEVPAIFTATSYGYKAKGVRVAGN